MSKNTPVKETKTFRREKTERSGVVLAGRKFKDMNKINALRKELGMPPVIRLERNCLCCEEKFIAHGSNNYKCGKCATNANRKA